MPSSLFFSTLALLSSGLILSLVLSSISTSQSSSAATNPTTVSADIIRVAFGLSIETDPSVTLNVKPTPAGAMTVVGSTVTTGTSSPSGYTLYLQMTGENSTTNSLINSVDTTATLTSSGSFADPTTLSSGTWGYAIPSGSTSLLNTNGFDDSYTEVESVAQTGSKFAAIPTSSSPAEKIAETNSPSVVELPVYYAAMASYDTISGTYSNKVLYTALADDGSVDRIAVAPSIVDVNTSTDILVATALYSTSDTASANIYLLTEDEYNSISGTNVEALGVSPLSCTVTDTAPHSYTCSLPAITSLGDYYIYVKYPNYDRVYSTTITVTSTAPLMQTFTPAMCDSMSIGESTTLQDTRDWSTYSVAKLADGNCWMTQNLRLGDGTKSYTLTPDDSNVATNFTLPVAQTSEGISWGDAANTGNDPHVYATGNETYGNYYNWYTATAGTGKGTMQSTSVTSLDNAASSICPKGWRLPDGGQSPTGSFYALDIALGYSGINRQDSTALSTYISAPYQFPYSGNYSTDGAIIHQSSYGSWWSRSSDTTAGRAYRFTIGDGRVMPQDYHVVGYGFPVRCLLSDFWNISTMQDMTPQVAASVATPTTSATSAVTDRAAYNALVDKTSNVPQRTLYDIRDRETYTIRKLADGNCWMTENLRLSWSSSRTLTSADTNINTTTSKTIDVATQATSTNGVPSTAEINAWKEGATAGGNWNRYLSRSNGTHTETNPSQSGAAATNLTGENQLIGTYYNWYTSTLGSLNSTTETPNIGVNAPDDICPKGWQLPRYTGSGSWITLIRDTYHIIKNQGDQSTVPEGNTGANNTLHAFPFSLPYSGEVSRGSGATVHQATYGAFWSAAPSSITYSRLLNFFGTGVWPETTDYRTTGFSVRCIAQ